MDSRSMVRLTVAALAASLVAGCGAASGDDAVVVVKPEGAPSPVVQSTTAAEQGETRDVCGPRGAVLAEGEDWQVVGLQSAYPAYTLVAHGEELGRVCYDERSMRALDDGLYQWVAAWADDDTVVVFGELPPTVASVRAGADSSSPIATQQDGRFPAVFAMELNGLDQSIGVAELSLAATVDAAGRHSEPVRVLIPTDGGVITNTVDLTL